MFQNFGSIDSKEIFRGGLNYFRVKEKISLGICITSYGIYCSCVKFTKDDDISVVFCHEVNCDTGDDKLFDGLEYLVNELSKDGVEADNVTLYIDENDVFYYHRVLDELNDNDLMAEVRLDISSSDPFEGDFLAAYCREENFVGAVSKSDVMLMVSRLKKANLYVRNLVTCADRKVYLQKNNEAVLGKFSCNLPERMADSFVDENMLYSLYGAVTGVNSQGLVFWLSKNDFSNWQWLRLGWAVMVLSWTVSVLACGWYYYGMYSAQDNLRQQQQEFARLQGVWDSKQRTDEINRLITKKTGYMKEQLQESLPAYAIMVHLAYDTTDGAWLTDVVADRGKGMMLQGEAASYNSMVKYYQQLEEDQELFAGKISLENSEQLSDGKIRFQMKTEL